MSYSLSVKTYGNLQRRKRDSEHPVEDTEEEVRDKGVVESLLGLVRTRPGKRNLTSIAREATPHELRSSKLP